MRFALFFAAMLTMLPLLASPANADCQWDEPTHYYLPGGGPMIVINDDGMGWGRPMTKPTAYDTCSDPYNGYLVGDGDPETGLAGGLFPAYQPCLDVRYNTPAIPGIHPTFAHHGAYDGAIYTATQDPAWSNLGLIVVAGTDGEEAAGTCIGDGIIDDVNPVDCGSGDIGTGIGQASGEVAANAPLWDPVTGEMISWADCTSPADGMVWVALPTGPAFTRNEGPIVVLLTPVDTCVDQLLEYLFGQGPGVTVPSCIEVFRLPEVHPQNLPHTSFFVAIPVTGTIEQTA